MNRFLLVNLNNTSTKLALSDAEKLLKKVVIPTKKLTVAGVRRVLQRWSFDLALVGSVVPQKTGIFRNSVKTPLLEVGPKLDLGVGIDFPRPETIGADRIANAVGVTHRHGTPAVVVDFGTAVTLYHLPKRSIYWRGDCSRTRGND
jgi:type III pantothenate kinase